MSISEVNLEFEALLDYLKQNCNFNLTGYKRSSLMRRFRYRMQQLHIESYENYLQYLQQYPQECVSLFNTVLINNSYFFRDPERWDYLANEIIPRIIANKQPHEKIRVWSAGCASGQEVYTLVILLAEALGVEQYLQRVQIFATDVDEDAINQARQGSYSSIEIETANIPRELVSTYFEQVERRYVFHPKLRRTIIFGCHDLVADAPMSKIDLLICRNVLIYFNLQAQAKILMRFHFALKSDGFLFLGSAESWSNRRQLFSPVNLKYCVFTKGQNLTLNDHLLIQPQANKKQYGSVLTNQVRIWQVAFEASSFAQLFVDCRGYLLVANEQAYTLFGLKSGDLGARVQNLEMGRIMNLCAVLKQLERDRHPLILKNREWMTDQSITFLNIYITPILEPNGKLLGVNFAFIDITQQILLENKLEHLNSNLTRVNQELQAIKTLLHTTTTELECTKNELEVLYQELQLRSSL